MHLTFLHGTSSTAGLALVATLGASLVTGACGSKAAAQSREEQRMLTALTEARDAVCACRELTCAEDAEQRLADFLLLRVDSLKKVPPRADTAGKAAQLDGELRTCKRRLEEAARPN